MTVRLKIALTIFLTGLLTAVGVIATVLFAFQRFEHEVTYYRASGFLERVTARHPDMFDMQERFQDDFNGFLSNLVLFEPDTQLYLLDSAGTLLASSSEKQFPKGFKVALGPVLEASGPEPMPYVLGDDPQRMTTASVVAARALYRTVIRNAPAADGYLYLVCQKATFAQGRLTALQSTFAQPTLVSILAVVALSTLLAAWVIAAVTRPVWPGRHQHRARCCATGHLWLGANRLQRRVWPTHQRHTHHAYCAANAVEHVAPAGPLSPRRH
jgi:hypothetical protein